jgi:hypothetical protein
MKTGTYIKELLFTHDCVVVPEFGAFLSQSQSARKEGHTIYPPAKTLSFNAQLVSNDGLLAKYASEAEGVPYEAALKQLLDVTHQWKKQIVIGIPVSLDGIGKLTANKEGNLVFTPFEKENLLLASFGMAPVLGKPILRESLKEEVVEMEEKIPFIITPERKEKGGLRRGLKYAAVILLAVASGLTVFTSYQQGKQQEQWVDQQVKEQVSKNIQEATIFDTQPMELDALDLTFVEKPSRTDYHVVAGAFRVRTNADKRIAQLQSKGYEATYLGVNKYGLHQVGYASFESKRDAINYLYKVQRNESSEAWLLYQPAQ